MEEVYARSVLMKIFYSALATGPAVFFTVMYLGDKTNGALLAIFALLLSLLAVFVIINQLKSKLIVSADRIVKINLWGEKELSTANVKGVRIEEKYLVIEPVSPNYARIVINNYKDYNDDGVLTAWLTQNFTDLDASDLEDQSERILSDTTLGATEQEREQKLANAKTIALVYNIAGVASGLWMMFTDYKISLITSLAFPLLAIVLMASNKLIRFVSSAKRSIYPYILIGFMMNSMFIVGKAVRVFDIYHFHLALIPALALCAAVVALLVITGINKAIPVTAQVLIMTFVGAIYSLGTILQVNCVFDDSTAVAKQTVMFDKYSDYNKGRHYHFRLSTLGEQPADSLNSEVSLTRYNRFNVGDTIPIYVKKGKLNIPWYSFYK